MTSGTGQVVRRPRDRKAQIAAAAAELFCARGFHNVGIDDIAASVGITGPAIYRHFDTKQDTLAWAIGDLSDALHAAAETGAELEDPRARLDASVDGLIVFALERRTTGRLYQWEGRYLTPEGRADFAARAESLLRTLRDRLLAVRPELGKRDARFIVLAMMSMLASPSTHRAKPGKAKSVAALRSMADVLLGIDPLPAPERAVRGARRTTGSMLPRREQLLIEAIRLFHESGYHAVSIEDIGAAVGINASSVYRHFPGKAHLLAAVYYRAAERVAAATTDVLAVAADAADALDRLVDSHVRMTFAQAELTSVYVSENENLPDEDRHALRAKQREHVDTWVRLVADGRRGEPAAVTRFRVHAALNLVSDLCRLGPPYADHSRTVSLVHAILRG